MPGSEGISDFMKNTVSIKLNREFQRVYKRGQRKGGRFLSVYALKNKLSSNRLGITVGKKFGNSVQRARMKRLIRENYRLIEEKLCFGYDIVVVARSSERTASSPNHKLKAAYVPSYDEIGREIKKTFSALGISGPEEKHAEEKTETAVSPDGGA